MEATKLYLPEADGDGDKGYGDPNTQDRSQQVLPPITELTLKLGALLPNLRRVCGLG